MRNSLLLLSQFNTQHGLCTNFQNIFAVRGFGGSQSEIGQTSLLQACGQAGGWQLPGEDTVVTSHARRHTKIYSFAYIYFICKSYTEKVGETERLCTHSLLQWQQSLEARNPELLLVLPCGGRENISTASQAR